MADFSPRFLACLPFVTGGANGIWSLGNMDQNTTTWRQSGAGEPHLNDVGAAAWSSVMYTSLIYGAPF